jgi:SAM-dependent methyltransferase
MSGFLSCARELLAETEYDSVIEVGCGPGDLAEALFPSETRYLGIDIDPDEVEKATTGYPFRTFQVGSAYELPVATSSMDLVIACEVLEHLSQPQLALDEIDRVARKWILISVPREPLWRILNVARGKYWKDWGNTPGHVQHFRQRDLLKRLETKWQVCKVKSPLPWTMVLACKP